MERVGTKLQAVLALNSELTFEAKYSNERTVRVNAPIAIAGSTLPYAVTTSKELSRRSVAFQLSTKVADWAKGGDVSRLRHDQELRRALDTIVADIWWLLHDAPTLSWREYCLTELGAVDVLQLDDGEIDVEGRNAILREIYEAYRTAPDTALTTERAHRGWLPCDGGSHAAKLLGELIDLNGDSERREAEVAELKRVALAEVLGFDKPNLELKLTFRSGRYIAKFTEIGKLRGHGCPRASLPPARGSQAALPEPGSTPPPDGEVDL